MVELIFLGTGTSHGVPVIGCHCAVCRSNDPRNRRTRPSIALRGDQGTVVIDTTPELRIQLLRERIDRVHAVLYTHAHADHVHGFDDIRIFPHYLGRPVPIYCEAAVERRLRQSFAYAFSDEARRLPEGAIPHVHIVPISAGQPFEVIGLKVLPVRLLHGRWRILGFRFGRVAYCTDVSAIPDDSWPLLEGLDHLILDALRYRPHPTHFSIGEALEVIERLRPGRAWLTHLCHEVDHAQLERELPDHVAPAYDGLRLDVTGSVELAIS